MVIADIEADLDANADWYATGSVSKARAYVTAATIWLQKTASSASNEGSSLSRDPSLVREMMKDAMTFATASGNNGGGRVRFLGVGGNFR
jgi:dihydroxyacetone kinase